MTESLRQESQIVIRRQFKLIRNRVLATLVEQPSLSPIWMPPEERQIFGEVVWSTPPIGILSQISPGDCIIIPPHLGIKVEYYGHPAIICQYQEVLAVIG